MADSRDPFEILRHNDPVDPATVPDAESDQARRLLHQITATRRPNLARRRRLIRAVAVAVAALLLAAAAWAVLYRDPTEPSGVGCYQSTDLASDRVVIRPDTEPSVDACTEPWRDGTLTNPTMAPGTVPPFTGCVTETGALAVFPTDDPETCERLGLAPANPVPADDIEPVVDLQNQLVEFFSTAGCVDMQTATDKIQAILDRAGLDHWRIQTQPSPPDRPCASFGLDPQTNTVILVPIPQPAE